MHITSYTGHFEVSQSVPRTSFEASETRRQHTNFLHFPPSFVLQIVIIHYYNSIRGKPTDIANYF